MNYPSINGGTSLYIVSQHGQQLFSQRVEVIEGLLLDEVAEGAFFASEEAQLEPAESEVYFRSDIRAI